MRQALQSLYEACVGIELAVQVGLDEGEDTVTLATSRAKAEALLAAIEIARSCGVRYGGYLPDKVEVREVPS